MTTISTHEIKSWKSGENRQLKDVAVVLIVGRVPNFLTILLQQTKICQMWAKCNAPHKTFGTIDYFRQTDSNKSYEFSSIELLKCSEYFYFGQTNPEDVIQFLVLLVGQC